MRKALYNEEEQLRGDLSIERLFGSDSCGRILVRETGNAKRVYTSGDNFEKLYLYCPLVTHSHPSVCPHSINDVVAAYASNTIEDRVVTKEGTYVMYPPDIEWTDMAIDQVLRSFSKNKDLILPKYLQIISAYDTIASNLHKPNPYREMREKLPKEVYVEIWKAVALETGITFYHEPRGYYVSRKIPPRRKHDLDDYSHRCNYSSFLTESYKLDRDEILDAINDKFLER